MMIYWRTCRSRSLGHYGVAGMDVEELYYPVEADHQVQWVWQGEEEEHPHPRVWRHPGHLVMWAEAAGPAGRQRWDPGDDGHAGSAAQCGLWGCRALRGCPTWWWDVDAGQKVGAGEGPASPPAGTHAAEGQTNCGPREPKPLGARPNNASSSHSAAFGSGTILEDNLKRKWASKFVL